MATLGSLAVLPDSGSTERFPRSFRLNQTCIHPPTQVVLKSYARDLDLLDQTSNQTAGKFCRQTPTINEQTPQARTPAKRMLQCVRSGSLNMCAAWVPVNRIGEPSLTGGLMPHLHNNRKNIN